MKWKHSKSGFSGFFGEVAAGLPRAILTLAMVALACELAARPATAGDAQADAGIFGPLKEAVVIDRVGHYGRAPFHADAVQREIAAGRWQPPNEGEALTGINGEAYTWRQVVAEDDGWLRDGALHGGYASVTVHVDEPTIAMLEARGHRMVYINGDPRAGDIYETGYVRLPVRLEAGENELLFHALRGRLRAALVRPEADVFFHLGDTTLPEIILDQDGSLVDDDPLPAGLIVINATDHWQRGLSVTAEPNHAHGQLHARVVTDLPPIPPLTLRKVPVKLIPHTGEDSRAVYNLALRDKGGTVVHEAELSLRVRRDDQYRRVTFISEVDGSVQYYAVNPARTSDHDGSDDDDGPVFVLSLHGASVEATSQARSYAGKPWRHIVAPNNRRPFGFDWEDWGRLDAIEVFDHARARLHHDPQRIYLTGHSMGGHGTWHLGVMFPDRFAAIGPSAGWISFWRYGGAYDFDENDAIDAMLSRAVNPSRTLLYRDNLADLGVYILHGDQDESVPVEHARRMREELGSFHTNFAYYERPGAGHWWGSQCMDWPPMFEFFRQNARTPFGEQDRVRFITPSPSISASHHWATIHSPKRWLIPARIDLARDRDEARIEGETENVARLALDVRDHAGDHPIRVVLDGDDLGTLDRPADDTSLWLERRDGSWHVINEPPPSKKGPHRAGPFKDAFRHRAVLVYGTGGTPAENDWAFAKARFDAEVFWYRGNGAFEIVADDDFDADAEPDRNVILYGCRETNSAWDAVLHHAPIEITRRAIRVGDRAISGDDLAALFIYPRSGSEIASVGVVGGTGLHGRRLTDRLPWFVSGVGYPDLTIFDSRVLTERTAGVITTGFFSDNWSIDHGEFAERER